MATHSNMSTFWVLMSRSVIISGLVAASVVLTICCLALMGREIPDVLVNIALTIVGYFFGSKVANTEVQNTADRRMEAMRFVAEQEQANKALVVDDPCCSDGGASA